jgi:choline dehydrogenase-like flavoprotein
MSSPRIEATVCVVGAGPAGIATALELSRAGVDVLLVESGSRRYSARTQALAEAEICKPQRHHDMQDAVRRMLGGTSHLWGGRCVPYDPIDFEQRDWLPEARWPIRHAEMARYLEEACSYCGCGSNAFTVETAPGLSPSVRLTENFVDGEVRSDSLERWSAHPDFCRAHGEALRHARGLRLLLNTTCVGLRTAHGGRQLEQLLAVDGDGTRIALHARFFVIACGGLETTRLLLNFCEMENGLRPAPGMPLGRYYMGHLSGKIASISFEGDPRRTLHGFERSANTYVRRRITFDADFQRRNRLLNTAFWLDNPPPADPRHRSGILSSAFLALKTPGLAKLLAPAAIRAGVTGAAHGHALSQHWLNVGRELPSVLPFVTRFLYQRYLARPRLPGFFVSNRANTYALHYHAEQVPDPNNRVELTTDRDALGLCRLRVHFDFAVTDAQSVLASHDALDRYLTSRHIGRLVYRCPIDMRLAEILGQARDGIHQIGTTRMGSSPNNSVTDRNARFFSTDNLYIASSSLFPSSSQANPTLTLVALSVRLGRHLAALAGQRP